MSERVGSHLFQHPERRSGPGVSESHSHSEAVDHSNMTAWEKEDPKGKLAAAIESSGRRIPDFVVRILSEFPEETQVLTDWFGSIAPFEEPRSTGLYHTDVLSKLKHPGGWPKLDRANQPQAEALRAARNVHIVWHMIHNALRGEWSNEVSRQQELSDEYSVLNGSELRLPVFDRYALSPEAEFLEEIGPIILGDDSAEHRDQPRHLAIPLRAVNVLKVTRQEIGLLLDYRRHDREWGNLYDEEIVKAILEHRERVHVGSNQLIRNASLTIIKFRQSRRQEKE